MTKHVLSIHYFQKQRREGQCHGVGGTRWDTVGERQVNVEEKLHRGKSSDININGNERKTVFS